MSTFFQTSVVSQRLNSFFIRSPELCAIARRAELIAAFQRACRGSMPPALAGASRVIGFDQRVVTLGADNGAVAAKLRQLAPRILPQLQGVDSEVTGILVKVQVGEVPPLRSRMPPALSSAGRRELADLAASLGESPLKCALQRLTRR